MVGKRSGEYGGWDKTSWPNVLNFWSLACMTWGRALCRRIGSFLLTSASNRHLQFSVHLINLLSILLRCNGFARIQKDVVDQTSSRLPNSDHDLSLVPFWLWEEIWGFFSVPTLSWSQPVVPLLVIHHNLTKKCLVAAQNKIRQHFRVMIFLICSQLVRHPLSKLFHLSNLFQSQMNGWMVNTAFFCHFSRSCKRISFNDGFQFSAISF